MSKGIKLVLENQGKSTILMGFINVTSRSSSNNEEWSDTQKKAHLCFCFKLITWDVSERVFYFCSVADAVLFKDSIQIISGLRPCFIFVGASVSSNWHKSTPW